MPPDIGTDAARTVRAKAGETFFDGWALTWSASW